jgi:hypothetical protein
MIPKDILDKMDYARRFLAAPAPEVVGDLIAEIRILTEQRDRLAMALQELCKALMTANPLDITELLNKAGDALQSLTTLTQPEPK